MPERDRRQAETVIPDARITRAEAGYAIELNASWEPRLSLNADYSHLLGERSGEAAAYLDECFRSAKWIIRSLARRKQTMLKVIQAMIEKQPGFLETGSGGLRPMTLADIAAAVEMHESTVSRAVSGKYMLTPHGVFSLRSLFSASLSAEGGEGASAAAVKHRLKEMVGGENKSRPWSDQQLAGLLAGEDIAISRRAVAKYREELRIPASSARKKRE